MSKKLQIPVEELECSTPGYANGISTQLHNVLKNGEVRSLTESEKNKIIDQAAIAYGDFLTALGVEWQKDPNSSDTPRRVAKAYVQDLWEARYNILDPITAFPSDGYTGIVFEGGIPLTSMCSHHHGLIQGKVHIAYIPEKHGKVIGLSKLNRLVEHFGRRGAIQEQLTEAIHKAVNVVCEGNGGVAVMIEATHACVSCRGVKHQGASMKTSRLSGCFLSEDSARNEFYTFIQGCK